MSDKADTLLHAPRLKIERARYHINDLSRNIDTYLSSNPFELIVHNDPTTAKRTYRVKAKKSIPDDFALILGDAVHNLRSALDLTVFAMVGDKAPRPEAVQFPFCARAEALPAAIKEGQIEIVGEDVIKAIEALEPYPGGNDLLSGLHTLDIADKHKLILVVGRSSILSANQIILWETGSTIKGKGALKFAEQGENVFTFDVIYANRAERRADRTFEKKTGIQPAFNVCFGDANPFGGQSVKAKLQEMVTQVDEIVTSLVTAYLK